MAKRRALANIVKAIDLELNNKEPEKSFLQDLKRSIELTNAKDFQKGSASYKPSSMNCLRQMYYIRTSADPDPTNSSFQLIGICNNGTDTHVRIQTYISRMKENGIDCEYVDVAEYIKEKDLTDEIEIVSQQGMETKLFHKSLQLSFLCDGIIKYRGQYYILELKTEGSNKFWSRSAVDPSHYNQASCYSLALHIDGVMFVYISRDSYDMKSYLFYPTDDMKQSIVGLITNCETYVQEKRVPPSAGSAKYSGSSKVCTYCQYKQQCGRD